MTNNILRYTLRINPVLMEKLAYVAEYDGYTKNKEIEQLIKKRIADFEKAHGEIVISPSP